MVLADTPPPNSVKAKAYSGDGATAITATGASLNTNITNTVPVSQSGVWTVGATISNFPATQAVTQSGSWTVASTQSGAWTTGRTWTLLNSTDSVDVGNFPSSFGATQSTSPWVVDGSGVTQPISAVSLPLPAGASTSALQTTGNSYLSSIDSKVPPLGQALAAASVPVVLTAAQLATLTPLSTIAATQSGTWNVGLNAGANTIGKVDQGTGGASAWKVDGSAVTQPVSAASLPLPTGAATSANQVTANSSLSSIDSKLTSPITVTGPLTDTQLRASAVPISAASLPLPTGAATSTKQSDGSQKTQVVDGSGTVQGPAQTISGTNYMPVVLAASATPGSAIVSRSIQVAGSDGTNARTLSVDTSGNLNVNTNSSAGRTSVNLARLDYTSTNVTTGAYVQLLASTSDTVNQLYIFDSSGQTLFLATGGAGSESNKIYVVPGGNGLVNLSIASGTRISLKAVSGTASAGEISVTFLK